MIFMLNNMSNRVQSLACWLLCWSWDIFQVMFAHQWWFTLFVSCTCVHSQRLTNQMQIGWNNDVLCQDSCVWKESEHHMICSVGQIWSSKSVVSNAGFKFFWYLFICCRAEKNGRSMVDWVNRSVDIKLSQAKRTREEGCVLLLQQG